jgi:phage shock protein A
MSRSADNEPAAGEATLSRLEAAVSQAVERISELEAERDRHRRRAEQLDRLLARIAGGDLPPGTLVDHLAALEAENADLRARVDRVREHVERLFAKIRFLDERR